jgi:hypothetical protein
VAVQTQPERVLVHQEQPTPVVVEARDIPLVVVPVELELSSFVTHLELLVLQQLLQLLDQLIN